MPNTELSKETLEQVRKALEKYNKVCERNLNTDNARNTYKRYAGYFVRWMNNDFTPGETLPK